MPIGVKDCYVSMLKKNPEDEKLEVRIKNFDDAQNHPDRDELRNAEAFVKVIVKQVNK